MPAVVNTSAVGSGKTATITTASATPGGVDRAVLVGALGAYDTTRYPSSANWTVSAVDTAIDQVLGTSTPIDIFAFFFAWSKTFSESGSPAAATTFSATWAAAPFAGAVGAICVEGADQTTPFGTEQISAELAVSSDPAVITDTYTDLLPGQLVVGFIYAFTVGDFGPVSYTEGGDITEVLTSSPDVVEEGRHPQVTPFWGNADGTGTFVASVSVDYPNTGELSTLMLVMRPVNDAAGGGDTPMTADHAAFGFTARSANLLAGRRVTANFASVALTARNANLLHGKRVAANNAALALTAQAATLRNARRVGATQAAVALAGQAATLRRTRVLAALYGGFALTGQDVALRRGLRVVTGFASFLLAGQATAVRVGRRLNIGHGSFSLSGQSADLRYLTALALTADRGLFSANGQSARLLYPKRLTVNVASFALTGQTVGLTKLRGIEVSPASFTVTGRNVTLLLTRQLTALRASVVVTVRDAALTYRAAYVRSIDRTLLIEPENRTHVIEAENRTIAIDAEDRTASI